MIKCTHMYNYNSPTCSTYHFPFQISKISRKLQLSDENGNKMDALTVFSESIKYLKDHMVKSVTESTSMVQEGDINWVLTVPAIWGDQAKQFMREAAVMVRFQQT